VSGLLDGCWSTRISTRRGGLRWRDSRQDRLYAADLAELGQTGRDRCRHPRWGDHGRGPSGQGTGARGQGTAPGQRDPEVGQCVFAQAELDRRLKW